MTDLDAIRASHDVIEPQPGPQTEFLESNADIVFYGGSAGGGKTYALLLECLYDIENKDFGAVIFRRTTKQVTSEGGLWDTATDLYAPLGAKPNQVDLSLKFPQGSKVTFAHMEHEKNRLDWQGSQIPLICCEVGTKVRMADGSSKRVERIRSGDMVQTLVGPKAVTRAHKPHKDRAVSCEVRDDKGALLSRQVHASSHKLLTPNGWVSYDDIADEPRPSLTCESKGCRCARRFSGRCDTIFRSRQPLHGSPSCRQPKQPKPFELPLDRQCRKEICACKGPQDQGNYYGLSADKPQEHGRRSSVRLSAILAEPCSYPLGHTLQSSSRDCEEPCARRESCIEDCQCHCSACRGPYGERQSWGPNSGLGGAQRLDDAEGRTRKRLPLDDPGKARKHTQKRLRYSHPYTGKERTSVVDSQIGSCEMTPCGEKELVHLSIEGECHYITESGLVNQNCFDELVHFTWKQFVYMLSRNRSTSGAKSRMRGTCNPDPDSWVRRFIDWWIDDSGYAIPDRSGIVRYFVIEGDDIIWADTAKELTDKNPNRRPKSFTFIRSTIQDNKILLSKDPDYLANLQALTRVERAQLMDGNWDIRPSAGSYFRRSDFEVVDAAPSGGQFVRAWDQAGTEAKKDSDDPDWTVGFLMQKAPNGQFYCHGMERFRVDASKVDQKIQSVASDDGHGVNIRLAQDPGQAGKSQARAQTKMLSGYTVSVKPVTGDKETRAKPLSSQVEAGNVKVVRGAWNEVFFNEMEGFPLAAHDDIVDAASDAFDQLTSNRKRAGTW